MSCYISNDFYYLFVFFFLLDFLILFHEQLLIYTSGIDIALFQIYIQQWSSAAVTIK